jgi:two-component system sensor histidine kinase/response regulator
MDNVLFEKTILIVDDTPENIDVLNGLLLKYKRKIAINGERALKIAFSDTPPDLILLDIMMPGMDGFEVCRQLRKNSKTADIPVIFLTAKASREDVIKGFESGGQDYITKPFDHHELLQRVNTHLELHNQREQLKKINEILDQKVKERTRELEASNSKLADALEKLKGFDRSKTTFLRLISHELRTPLNGILGSAYFLKEAVEDPEMTDFIDMLKVSADRLNRLSNLALEITEMQINGKSEEKDYCSLNDIIKEAISEYKDTNPDSQELIVTSDDDKEVFVNRKRFVSALTELLINAHKFSTDDSPVLITSGGSDNAKWICIENSSEPLDEALIKEIVKPFGLAKDHSDSNTGLGLTFVNMVMTIHEGKMEISHSNGKTKVCLTLLK